MLALLLRCLALIHTTSLVQALFKEILIAALSKFFQILPLPKMLVPIPIELAVCEIIELHLLSPKLCKKFSREKVVESKISKKKMKNKTN